jgi:hypothetical protein
MIHHIFANRSNIGDWLSAQGIQRLLAPLPVKEYLCDAPFVPETIASLTKDLAPEDLVIVGGGGLLSNYFTPFWEAFAPLARRAPLVIWGVGCCDIKMSLSLPAISLIQPIFASSRMCVVRDELTRVFVDCGDHAIIVPCPTFNAISSPDTIGDGLLHVDHYDTIGSDNYDAVVRMTEDYAVRTGRICRQTNNLISSGNRRELDERLARYRNSELVVTSRLHGCIIGLATGCKVLAISGDRKVESFMHAAGMDEWVCDVTDLAMLPAMIERLPTQNSPIYFIETTRQRNCDVAHRVQKLYREHSGDRA